ncbi:hypothetical protein GGR57DRAFT_464818 [Xylariaceae sp. FL1272]|nr:hypothetical protein GGR57DRAFT_464818 [Xylariaceae sp. FL1272]
MLVRPYNFNCTPTSVFLHFPIDGRTTTSRTGARLSALAILLQYLSDIAIMDNSSRDHPQDRSESSRKRPRQHANSPERHVRRRTRDDYPRGNSPSPPRNAHEDVRHHRRDGERVDSGRDGAERRRRHSGGARQDPRGSSSSHQRHHHRHHRRDDTSAKPVALPCNARALSRSSDLDAFRPLFARYLDIQKQIDIATLEEREIRGRWKSFVAKWNSAELAEGWYRPETYEDALLDYREDRKAGRKASSPGSRVQDVSHDQYGSSISEASDNEDDYGPTLPSHTQHPAERSTTGTSKHCPGIPSLTDLTYRDELRALETEESRSALRAQRKADRQLQKERLEDLAPKAAAGSHERKMEKRLDARNSNKAFAEAKTSDAPEINDNELMGEGGGVDEYKRMRREADRRKNEREVRREEIERARREEREERIREYREREAGTVDMLREIAKARFG